MIEEKSCPLCGANSFKEVFKAPYFRGDGELFAIKECENCELWFTSPRPANEDLGKYYESEDYISHSDKRESIIDHVYHLVRTYSLKKKVNLITRLNGEVGRLLDFGAGTGHFVKQAKIAGWDVIGLEPSADARNVAAKNGDTKLEDPSAFDWTEAKMNVISLWHVLEHVTDLHLKMQDFNNALIDGGILIIAVPNHESYDSQVYGKNWAALDVPLHLYHFKKRNIKELAEKFGFVLEEVINMPFDSYYVSMLSEKVESGKQNLIKGFWTGFKSNLKGLRTKNQSSLVYVLRKPK